MSLSLRHNGERQWLVRAREDGGEFEGDTVTLRAEGFRASGPVRDTASFWPWVFRRESDPRCG